jgi:hypothetical protein
MLEIWIILRIPHNNCIGVKVYGKLLLRHKIATPPSPGHPSNAFLEGLYATLVQLGIELRRDWYNVTPSDALVLIQDASVFRTTLQQQCQWK